MARPIQPFRVISTVPETVSTAQFLVSAYTAVAANFPEGGPVSSAGVFDSTGKLVRVLWSAQRNDPRVSDPVAAWDGLIDVLPVSTGTIATTGSYTIKVIDHDLQYQWDGTVGNTSPDHSNNMFYHNEGGAICDMEITTTGRMYYVTGYNERWPVCSFTTEANPQEMDYPVAVSFRSHYASQFKCCTDNTRAYFGYVPIPGNFSGVYAVQCSDNTIWSFTNGTTLGNFDSVINIHSTGDLSSLAVQRTGDFLFQTQSTFDRLDVMNKTTGAVATSSIGVFNAPSALAASPIASELWITSSPGGVVVNTITKLNIHSTTGAISTTGVVITEANANFIELAISPDGSRLLAIDAGDAQQVIAYNTSDGSTDTTWASSGRLGESGGYANTPTVSNTRFMFKSMSHLGSTGGYIAFSSDGSFWLGDNGNERSLHFSSGNSPTYIEQIAYNGGFYSTAVDRSDPTRVTVNYLEYEVDYSFNTITPDNGSWVLLNNWGFEFDITEANYFTRLEFLGTYSNGRRYASVYDTSVSLNRIWELTATGMRDTGATFTRGRYIDEDFNLNRTYFTGSSPATWRILVDQYPFAGFDGSGNPSWGAAVNIFTSGLLDLAAFPPPQSDPNFKVQTEGTSNGVLPIFQTSGENGINYYGRLGGLDMTTGAIRYDTHPLNPSTQGNQLTLMWPESPFFSRQSGALSGGPFFYIPGDSHLFTSYRGEEWGNNQVAQWFHWHESGLLLERFGVVAPVFAANSLTFPEGHTVIPSIGAPTVGIPNSTMSFKGMEGMTGNFGWGNVALVDGVYYIYPSDEWYHGGLSRWSCRGANTIRTTEYAVSWDSSSYTSVLDANDLLSALPYAMENVPTATYSWTISTTSLGTDLWRIRTNEVLCNPHNSPDLAVFFATFAGPRTASKTIPRVGSGNWSLDTEVFLIPGAGNTTNGVFLYIDVLDNTGKVIVRTYGNLASATNVGLFVNDVQITPDTGFAQDGSTLLGAVQPLVISANVVASTMSVVYANNYSTSGIAVYEGGANVGSPTTFRIMGQGFGAIPGANTVAVFTQINYSEA